jgi:parallel beta-helix repeat protein
VRRSLGRRLFSVAAALAVVGAIVAVNANQAFASHVSCGQTITQDTTLDSDLTGCENDGIVIGADNITLDLNGHTIAGTAFDTGVDNPGHQGVVIENGTIQGFYDGVGLYDVANNTVRGLTVSQAATAISVYDSNNSTVENNSVTGVSGIGLTDAHGNVIRNNAITGRNIGIGIYLFPFSSGNTIARNSVRLMNFGATLFDADQNTLDRNSFVENGLGMWLIGSEGSDGNVLTRNVASLNGDDGFFVAGNSKAALLVRNVADGNGDDGIDVDDGTATLTKNRADQNHDLGIEAVAGVTDGGGNRAFGNGNPLQCLHVACN